MYVVKFKGFKMGALFLFILCILHTPVIAGSNYNIFNEDFEQKQITKTLNRIKVRANNGNPEFYDSITSETFTPIGFNHTRLDIVDGKQYAHVTFENDYYNTAEVDDILKKMSDNNHNTIRVWFDHIWNPSAVHQLGATGKATEAEPIDKNYINNIIDFLKRARDNNVYVILCMDHTPRRGIYRDLITSINGGSGLFSQISPEVLHEGFMLAKERYLKECISYIKQTDPTVLSTILAFQLDNEMAVFSNEWPFNLNGKVVLADGIEYDMTVREQRQAAYENNYKLYANRMDKVIKSIDPEALTCTGLYTPLAVGKISNSAGVMPAEGDLPGADNRYPPNVKVLLSKDCNLDFVDIHLYPRGNIKKYLDSIDWDNLDIKAKPIILGEYGEWKRSQPNKFVAASHLLESRKIINSYGIIGGLVWLWNGYNSDTNDGAFYTPVNTENLLAKVLSPKYNEEFSIIINNQKHCFYEPIFKDGNTLLIHASGIVESIGGTMELDELTGTYVFKLKNGVIVKFKLGSKDASINDKKITLDKEPLNKNNQILIPLSLVTEAISTKEYIQDNSIILNYEYDNDALFIHCDETTTDNQIFSVGCPQIDSNQYTINFSVFLKKIDRNATSPLNPVIQLKGGNGNTTRITEISFNPTNKRATISSGLNGGNNFFFVYELNKWYDIKIIINKSNKTFDFYLDNVLVESNKPTVNNTDVNFGLLSFTAQKDTQIYFDNVLFKADDFVIKNLSSANSLKSNWVKSHTNSFMDIVDKPKRIGNYVIDNQYVTSNGNPIISLDNTSSVGAKVRIQNLLNDEKEVNLILALYKNDKLEKFIAKSVKIGAGATQLVEIDDVSINKMIGYAYRVKAFLWGSLIDMMPIYKSVEVRNSK